VQTQVHAILQKTGACDRRALMLENLAREPANPDVQVSSIRSRGNFIDLP
jgi:hypothetical protein